ncbi:bax Inhibitor-1 isoform X2 [Rhynchophorus ferrugineus]|uniref:bax Inhibitor-1 isoform X2 n=1 Tax=Rhynchophorus ferrugineus TaxID=354439 RepID=UPI003FCDED2B
MERPGLNTFLNSFSTTLEAPVKQHIKNVYACLSMSTLAAGLGASIHLFTNIQAGFLSAIGALVFLFLLMSTPDDNGKGMTKRVGYLLGFSTLTGVGLGPILETAILINPSVIITAFIGTSVIFVSFTLCALLSKRGQWIYLGGILTTLLNSLLLMSLANIFFGSTLLFNAQVYLGLIAMCGFVLYDTQAIIEKRRQGNKDFVAHSLDLFIDFLGIFKRLLIILMQKEEESNKKRRR